MKTLKILDVVPKRVRNVYHRGQVTTKTVWFLVLQVGTGESRLSIPTNVALRIREEMKSNSRRAERVPRHGSGPI